MAAAKPGLQLDDSVLNQTDSLVADIRKRLDVEEKTLEDGIYYTTGPVQLDEPPGQVAAEIESYFAEGKDNEKKDGLVLRSER